MTRPIVDASKMKTLVEVINDAEQLSLEDQAGLTTYLLSKQNGAPLGPDDSEIARRDREIDTGKAKLLTHDDLCKAVGR
jgi:hypothetical protein